MKTARLYWLDQIDRDYAGLAGIKGANLGELIRLGFDTPACFVVSTKFYEDFFSRHRLTGWIRKTLKGIDINNTHDLQRRALTIQQQISALEFSSQEQDELREYYEKLTLGLNGSSAVAIRGSATGENLPQANVAGQQVRKLGVKGFTATLGAIKEVWGKLFSPQAIYYRLSLSSKHYHPSIAVLIQAMIEPAVAGIMFTMDPISSKKDVIVIDAVWGLGAPLNSGILTPDRYELDKKSSNILDREVVEQKWKLTFKAGRVQKIAVPTNKQQAPKLTAAQIKKLAKIAQKIESHWQFPQDIEWAIAGDKVYLFETRPITTLVTKLLVNDSREKRSDTIVLLHGKPASLGIVSGRARVIDRADDLEQLKTGEILVLETATPDIVNFIKKARGIITDAGSEISHAAIIARELGLPAIVATGLATHIIKTGQTITMDGGSGKVYAGIREITHQESAAPTIKRRGIKRGQAPRTATKIYVNISQPALAQKVARMGVDGVGLIRSEFLIATLGEHPISLLEKGQSKKYVNHLTDGIEKIARAFYPHPVIYRASDLKTNEYRVLKDGEKFEVPEENPIIGFRGAVRYLEWPELFMAELEAIGEVRGRRHLDNVWLTIPFVRTPEELAEVKKMVDSSGLSHQRRFKLWMMIEVPSNVLMLEEFLQVGIDGISVGTNDLSQLLLGVDRENALLNEKYSVTHPIVLKALQRVIKIAKKSRVRVCVCGSAVAHAPQLTEFLIKSGVDSLSVSSDYLWDVRELVAAIENE